jgi:hypothetical protein
VLQPTASAPAAAADPATARARRRNSSSSSNVDDGNADSWHAACVCALCVGRMLYRLPRPTTLAAGAALAAGPLLAFAFSALTFLARSLTSRMALSRLAWRNCGQAATGRGTSRQQPSQNKGIRGRVKGGHTTALWLKMRLGAAPTFPLLLSPHPGRAQLPTVYPQAVPRPPSLAQAHLGLLCPPLVDHLQADTHNGAGSRLVGHAALLAGNLSHLVLLVRLPVRAGNRGEQRSSMRRRREKDSRVGPREVAC